MAGIAGPSRRGGAGRLCGCSLAAEHPGAHRFYSTGSTSRRWLYQPNYNTKTGYPGLNNQLGETAWEGCGMSTPRFCRRATAQAGWPVTYTNQAVSQQPEAAPCTAPAPVPASFLFWARPFLCFHSALPLSSLLTDNSSFRSLSQPLYPFTCPRLEASSLFSQCSSSTGSSSF